VLDDDTIRATPYTWGRQVVAAYTRLRADRVVGEVNQGGEMVEHVVRTAQGGTSVSYKAVHATRGKRTRAEPVSALYEQGLVHHLGVLAELEDEMCTWDPTDPAARSPNRVDALVWALTELALGDRAEKMSDPYASW
jgi:phage terminase large subunit-like protein